MKQKPKPIVKKPTPAQKPAPKAAAPTISWMDRLEGIKGKAVWISMAAVALVALFVYWDYVTLEKVLLYKDIGSDSINIFYPYWYQYARIWAEYGGISGYSLSTMMGTYMEFTWFDLSTWALILNGPENVPYQIAFFEVVKVLLIGLFSYKYFKLLDLRSSSALLGSLCFSFSGYMALGSSGWTIHSMQVVYIVLSLWSVEYFIGKRKLYFMVIPIVTWFVSGLTGYLAVYLFIGLSTYVFIRHYENGQLSKTIIGTLKYVGLALIGILLALPQMLTWAKMLFDSGRSESMEQANGALASKMNVSMFSLAEGTEYTSVVLRAFSTNLLGVGNNFKGWMNFLEAPLLYMGLAMLFFIPFFLVGNDKHRKLLYGILIGAVFLVLIFPWFRYAFWGFKLDYFREFTMLIGAFLLTIAIRGFDRFHTLEHKHTKWYALGTTAFLLILLFRFSGDGVQVDESRRAIITFFVVLMGALTFLYSIMRKPALILMIIALSALELGYNANATINDREVLSTREIESGKLYGDATLKALDWIEAQDSSLFRVSKSYPSGPTVHSSLNDAMVQGFNGLVGYSSFHNKYYLRFMGESGCIDRSDPNTAKWVVGIINRQYLSAFLGAKYFLFKGQPFGGDPVSFPMVKQVEDVFIHKTPLAMPLLVAYDSYITEDDYRTLENGSKDLTIYRALIANPDDMDKLKGLRQISLQDSLPPLTIQEFAKAATERRAMMDVDARAVKDGISASVDLKKNGIVVVQIPYSENMVVKVDGQVQESFVGNFGFFAFPLSAGKHEVEVVLGE